MTDTETRKNGRDWLVTCITFAVTAEDAYRAGDRKAGDEYAKIVAEMVASTKKDEAHILMSLMIEMLTSQFFDQLEVKKGE